jgi:spoIIIJ-associated protein
VQRHEPVERREPAPAPAAASVAEMLPDGHDEVLDKTEAIVSKLLFLMGLQAQVSAHYGEPREDRRPVMVDVRGSDLGILIGRRGQTLDAFQYIAALVVGKETGQFMHLVVDVEGHRDRRERQLRQLAQRTAEQVLKTGRKMTLEPMRPAERRIIHIELREHPAVTTESAGEDPYRKVTIIPKE